jgi:hypothetical protein
LLSRVRLVSAGLFLVATLFFPASTRAEISCSAPGLGGARVCTAGIAAGAIAAIANRQAETRWCWAATISNVFGYYGHPVTQARVVKETYGRIANVAGSEAAMSDDLNRTWVDDRGKRFRVVADDVREPSAAEELARGRPLIVTMHNHAVILTGLTYVRRPNGSGSVAGAIVHDPWPANPNEQTLTPADWRYARHLFRIRIYNLDS